jgi:hypothetical protein
MHHRLSPVFGEAATAIRAENCFLALLKPVLLLQEYHEDNAILSGPLQQARPGAASYSFLGRLS